MTSPTADDIRLVADHYAAERRHGIRNAQGILTGLAISLAFWAAAGAAVFAATR